MKFRTLAALVASALLCGSGAALADQMSGTPMPQVTMQASRFSGPGVYTGQPALAVTLSMIEAGGGPSAFDSVALVKTLTGAKFTAEVGALNAKFGKDKVGNFLKVFNFVVADSLKIVKAKGIALPSTPQPDPKDGAALSKALWDAGQTGSGFNVEVMLDRAVSHPIHVQVMKDVDAKYGIAQDADYHAVLNQAMHDLASVYKLS